MKEWSKVIRQLTMLSQLSLSLVTPLLMCLGVCYLLTEKLGIGVWIYFPGFFFGLGGSVAAAWKGYQSVMKKEKKNSRKGKSFNGHI